MTTLAMTIARLRGIAGNLAFVGGVRFERALKEIAEDLESVAQRQRTTDTVSTGIRALLARPNGGWVSSVELRRLLDQLPQEDAMPPAGESPVRAGTGAVEPVPAWEPFEGESPALPVPITDSPVAVMRRAEVEAPHCAYCELERQVA